MTTERTFAQTTQLNGGSNFTRNADTTQVGADVVELHSFGADIDLTATPYLGPPARQCIVQDAGSGTKILKIRCVGVDGTPVDRSLPVVTGTVINVAFTHVLTTTSCASILVIF